MSVTSPATEQDIRKYRRRFVFFGCVAAVLAIAAAITKPYLLALFHQKYLFWPMGLYGFVLMPIIYMSGALCAMSAVSALFDISIKNRGLRIALLALGAVILSVFLGTMITALLFHLPKLPEPLFWIYNNVGRNAVLYAVPTLLLCLGANSSGSKKTESE